MIELSDNGEPLPARRGRTYFNCDETFDCQSTNTDVYGTCVQTVESFLHGVNGSIISHGQTGSGKTFTILGNKAQKGIIHFVGMDVLNHIRRNPNLQFGLSMSAFEIYNQEARDLYTEDIISVRQDPKTKVLVDVSEVDMNDLQSFYDFVKFVQK